MEENNNNSVIKMAVGIIITLMVIGIGIGLFAKVLPSLDSAHKKVDTVTEQMDSMYYKNYDSTVVSGSEVLSAINTKASEDVTVTVATIGVTTPYNSSTYNQTNVNAKDFIEPTAKFKATIDRNDNKAVKGITFTQQK